MPSEINYKVKYLELRSKYINDLDTAFRLGFEAGAQEAQQQSSLDAQAQASAAPDYKDAGEPQNEQPQGSELDQHIAKLEGMLGSEKNPEQDQEIKKSMDAIKSLRKAEKLAHDMKKSEAAISSIAKALHKPAYKVGVQAQHNMDDNAKKAVSLQHQIVNDVMEKWQKEEERAGTDIMSILKVEGLTKE